MTRLFRAILLLLALALPLVLAACGGQTADEKPAAAEGDGTPQPPPTEKMTVAVPEDEQEVGEAIDERAGKDPEEARREAEELGEPAPVEGDPGKGPA